ncbi:MAG: HAMP domain-containing protein, partial [Leptospiraceae bacterium]|nr:HAMP domain-containing protein [Leptospiraceae bacterium]
PSSFLHSREPIVGLGVPSEKGVFLVALSSLRKIQLAFDKMSINTSFMVNGKGIILAHSEDKLSQVAIDYSGHEMVKFMFNNKLGNGLKLYKDIEGKSYIGAYKKLSFGNAGVISFINEDLAMEEVYNIQRRNLYIMIIALCISLLILYYLTEKITRPLMKLLVETIKISQGEFKVNIEKETEDEVGLLSEYFIQMARGLDERERVKEAFTRFINKDIVNKVIRGEISLGGELRKAAIFFSDVRGFTAIAEKISPEELILFLNGYLSLMVSCIGSHHGIVVDLMGDGIYAAWGATYTAGNDCENAINSALTMRKTLIQYNNYREKEGDEPIQIGCGINYGEVISGMVGSFDRMQYSLIGDTVNYASRLESLNKAFDTDILISEEAKQEVEGIYKLEKLKPVKVKGKEKEQQVYAVLGRMDDPDCPSDLNSLRVLLKITSIGLSEKEKEKLKEGHEEKYDVLD